MFPLLVYVAVAIVGALIGGGLFYVFKRKTDPILARILEYLTDYYLDEKFFSVKKLSDELQMPQDVVEKALVKLEKAGIIMKTSRGYSLVDPLVFLTPRDYERALRLTKEDNLLYGAYQMYYIAHPILTLIQVIIILIPLVIIFFTIFNLFGFKDLLAGFLAGKADPLMFSLFVFALSMLLLDIVNNIIKFWAREKYSVVVGYNSGILYDTSATDELSGRISRGAVSRIDIDISLGQKINNYFGAMPVGNVKVWVRGRNKPVVFRSLPYPRELFLIIRSVQLGSLQWRKRHARELALWRGRVYPFLSYGRKGRGGRR